MKFFLSILLCLTVLIGGLAPPAFAHHAEKEPSDGTVNSFIALKLPKQPEPFTFTGPGNKPVTLSDFRGQVVLVNIWATWCPPCVAELPALNRLQKRFKDKPFKIIALSTDRKKKAHVERAFKGLGLDALDLYLDPWHGSEAAFPLDVLPANFLIGPDGKVHAYLRSAVDWDRSDADALINHYLTHASHPKK